MKLIEVTKTATSKSEGLRLSEQQIKWGNILTDTIQNGMIGEQIVLTAIPSSDERKLMR